MYLKHLKIANFKNISSFDEEFMSINCFVGNNGVGKTNILDAIHYLGFCKSYFGHSDFDSIKQGEEFFMISGDCQTKDSFESYSCHLQQGSKKIFRHSGKAYTKHSEHIGKLPEVMITPNDHVLIEGNSEIRRKFIDMVISQYDKLYLKTLIQYNKSLVQRNKILKDHKSGKFFDSLMLQITDEQMDSYSKIIQQKRREFFSDFAKPFSEYYQLIGTDNESVSIEYKTYEGNLIDILANNREKDLIIGHTSSGIHRDDLLFYLNGNPIKVFGSQGPQKTYLLALKLAQFDYLCVKLKTKPILMIDDIFDKLDFRRVNLLISLIAKEHFGQIFITDTHSERIESLIGEELKDKTRIFKL
jgi:DNA replication and repair protein RecF